MDNFDNFFNKAGDGGSERTPVYHTPDSTGGGPNKKMTTVTILFVVIAVSIRRKLSPANFCNPSLMIFIPYKNSAKEPISRRKSKKE